MAGFVRPPTAQEAVLAELRAMISGGELRPGQPIRQEALAARFGVSRVPVREALRILAAEGQAVYEAHRGYAVAELDVAELAECYRIRDLLEAEAVRSAQLSGGVLAAMEAAVEEMDRAGDDVLALAAANRTYHFTLYAAAGLPRLLNMIRVLWDATDAYRSRYFNDAGHRRTVNDEHRTILAALAAGDRGTAVRLLSEHRAHALAALTEELT